MENSYPTNLHNQPQILPKSIQKRSQIHPKSVQNPPQNAPKSRSGRDSASDRFRNPFFLRLGGVSGRFARLLGSSWVVLGASWAVLGASWGRLGASWGRLGRALGRLGSGLGPLGGFLGRFWIAKKATRLGPYFRIDFCSIFVPTWTPENQKNIDFSLVFQGFLKKLPLEVNIDF